MKKLILFLFIIVSILGAQQINHDFGMNASGVSYTSSGDADVDSTETLSIVFDLQDYYFVNWESNSDRIYIGTFHYYIDANAGTDSVIYWMNARKGIRKYPGRDFTNSNTWHWSTDTLALVALDTTVGDVQPTFVNVYLGTAEELPTEVFRIDVKFPSGCNDNMGWYWDFAYPAVYQREQDHRTGTIDERKPKDTLH